MKRTLFLLLPLLLLLTACGGPSPEALQEQRYQTAIARMEAGCPAAALPLFRTLAGYRDSDAQRKHCAFALVRSWIHNQGSPYTPLDDSGAVVAYRTALTQPGTVTRYAALDQDDRLVFGCGTASSFFGGWVYTITLDETSSFAETAYLGLQRFRVPVYFQGGGSLSLPGYVQGRSTDMPLRKWQDDWEGVALKQLSDTCSRQNMQVIQSLPVDAANAFLQPTGVTLADLGFVRMEGMEIS